MNGDEMATVDERLDKIETKIDTIAKTLQTVAVQSERITNLQGQLNSQQNQIDAMWRKYDELLAPNGIVATVRAHQASCPRGQVKWLWTLVVPLSLALLGVGFKMFS